VQLALPILITLYPSLQLSIRLMALPASYFILCSIVAYLIQAVTHSIARPLVSKREVREDALSVRGVEQRRMIISCAAQVTAVALCAVLGGRFGAIAAVKPICIRLVVFSGRITWSDTLYPDFGDAPAFG
jgi:hypothetical protein